MKTKIKHRFFALCAGMLYVLAAGHPVLAEDIEVLVGPDGLTRMSPNVLFILDSSSSMGWDIDGNSTPAEGNQSRLEILQDVFESLMRNPFYQGINVALMRFDNQNNGGYFISPMQELNNNSREEIIDKAERISPDGQTPLSETLYEAALFWGGLDVGYGKTSSPETNTPDVFRNEQYISPIGVSECQKNYTILITDGGPAEDRDLSSNTRRKVSDELFDGLFIKNEHNKHIDNCTALPNDGQLSGDEKLEGRCLDDIAKYLNTVDQASDIPGTQTVQTYTIGFTTVQTLLEQTATQGGGTFLSAKNKEKLEDAFTSILSVIANANDSFSPPALAANTFNGIAHINRLYYTLFEPAATPKWSGNVKPYQLNDDYQLVDAATPPRPVVNANGMFLEESRSFWSDTDDGAEIVIGGANSRLPDPADRNLYTYTGDYDDATGLIPDTPEISKFNNVLKNIDSSNLTAKMLGIGVSDDGDKDKDSEKTDDEFTRVLDTIRSAKIGAPLHSQPALVTYGGDNAENADLTLFVATNDGFLHALDASPNKEGTAEGGKELFAFIPKELLPNLPKLVNKTGSMVYGLDGNVSVWVKESDDPDSTIEIDDKDHVYVYVGMRRGGVEDDDKDRHGNYYALDVTDRTAPTLKWVIRGGEKGTPGFEELGQSWSKPILTSVKYGKNTRKVLIFGGGYDLAQDNHSPNTDDDTVGRAIFIVDADTGERLWWAGPENSGADLELKEITHSIPSDIRLMDSNRDGHTDRLYVGDMRGQIFRFDLQASTSGVTGKGIRLARLSGNTKANNRRFYYPPDVVITQRPGAAPYISINIGSGYRAHPLNPLREDGTADERVNDRFYSLRDTHVVGPIPKDVTITPISDGSDGSDSNLFDATDSLVTNKDDINILATATGWYITLGNGSGEKVLAPSITLNGEVFFTTYTPPAQVEPGNCGPPPGTGRLYRVSLFDAAPTRALNGDDADDALTLEDRFTPIKRPGIPSGPAIMFRENSSSGRVEIVNCVGTECEGMSNPNPIQKIYWQEGN